MATEIPIDYELVKRTYRIHVKHDWISTPWRDKLSKFLLSHGATKVKRAGSSKDQCLYVSWTNDDMSNNEIASLIHAAICMFVEGKSQS